jgi:intein/homing endonuclease
MSGDMMVEKDDLVWMADGSWKVASELKVGDEVMSINIPAGEDVDITKHSEVDYNISLEEFKEITTYRTNKVTSIAPKAGFIDTIRMIFSDGTDWFDTADSSYPILDPEDGTVMFRELKNLKVGDKVILAGLESTEEEQEQPNYIVQEIVGLETERVEIEGYNISTDGSHLVLTRTSEDAGAYISIEHNALGSCWCKTVPLMRECSGTDQAYAEAVGTLKVCGCDTNTHRVWGTEGNSCKNCTDVDTACIGAAF